MYVSTLRQKQGELRALDMLESQYINSEIFIPNIILNDSLDESLRLIKSKFDSLVILDTRNLTVEEIEELESHVLLPDFQNFHINYSVENCTDNWPTQKFNYIKFPKNLINEFIVQWVQANQSFFPDNIMFDFEYMDSTLSEQYVNIVTRIIDILGDKNYIICSGAIPNTLPVKADINYDLQRWELDIYNQINSEIKGNFIFSDYSTVSPIMATGGIAIVQIKYTLEDSYWFVRNGQRRGNYDFVSVCDEIVNNASTYDASSCWADEYIQNVHVSRSNSGNPSVWASLGINKHIVICINENI